MVYYISDLAVVISAIISTTIFIINDVAGASRNVPALTDYCQRFPPSALCSGGSSAGVAGNANGSPPIPPSMPPPPSGAAGQSPQLPPSSSSSNPSPGSGGSASASPQDAAQYCYQYSANYKWFCLGGGAGDPKAAPFCPSYAQACNVPPGKAGTGGGPGGLGGGPTGSGGTGAGGAGAGAGAGGPVTPLVSNNPVCAQYAQVASTYCTGPGTENAQVQPSCDQYRANCQVPGATPVQPVMVNQQQMICYQYQQQYLIICVQQRPVTPAALQFCQQFAAMCLNGGRGK